MRKWLEINFALWGMIVCLTLKACAPAAAQTTVRPCVTVSSAIDGCKPVSATVPMPVSGSITPSGTQDVNLTQILGAVPSATNPIWVSPATASTPWVVSNGGTFAVQAAQSGTWTVQPGNTANTTPWLVTASPASAAGAGTAPVSSSALAANQVIKASAGNLYGFQVAADSTLSAAAWWVMIYNATSAPVDGAITPAKCYAMPTGTTSFAASWPTPAYFSTGITIGVSTTGCFTKTASTHAFISGDAQ